MSHGNKLLNPSTCLSPTVQNLICETWKISCNKLQTTFSANGTKYVNEDGSLDWVNLREVTFKDFDISSTPEDFHLCVTRLVPVSLQCHDFISDITAETFTELFRNKLMLTGQWQVFLECFHLLQSKNEVNSVLSLLLCTAALERALGDVFLMKNSPCPFLLKDLLATDELREIFSDVAIFTLHILIGPPRSLNLRNVAWHGFAAPSEIPKQYVSFLMVFTASLTIQCDTLNSQLTTGINHRQPFQLSHFQHCKDLFPDITSEDVISIQQLFKTSDFILPIMQQYWQAALQYYANRRYGLCCVLLLPQLENSLRRLFCAANRCPERVLTAESSVFYTTFDEILSSTQPSGEVNEIVTELGDSYMELLNDLLIYLEGPRIRDHISHGEVDILQLHQSVANHLLCVCIAFCLKYSTQDIREHADTKLTSIRDAAANYRSCFHPVAYLKRSLISLSTELTNLEDLPKPDSSDGATTSHLLSGIGCDKLQKIIRAILENSIFSDEVKYDSLPLRPTLSLDFLHGIVLKVTQLTVSTLYMTRTQLEVVSLLRRITSHGIVVVKQIIEVSETRFQQWQSKQLRSRQRNNYMKFLKSVPLIFLGLSVVVLIIATQLGSISSLPQLQGKSYQQHLKYLKGALQYVENLSTLTSLEKNKWDESCKLTEDFLDRTERFYS
ncbi:endoplasmic reticulum membrane-associated RNA degradation protein-like [Ptychodera flava]|uniref:endoplasmic reticulum membrane-associated RNA degradation protein-like n=1 Tax=Ptychodera flava TaxID=63121 RepID=UPI00396A80E3